MRDIEIATGVLVPGPVAEDDEERIADDAITSPDEDISDDAGGE